jgi:hypothetical protein
LWVVEDFGKLSKMGGPQEMVDVADRLLGEEPQRLALDAERAARKFRPARRPR